jgi:hypothetical protein
MLFEKKSHWYWPPYGPVGPVTEHRKHVLTQPIEVSNTWHHHASAKNRDVGVLQVASDWNEGEEKNLGPTRTQVV